MKKFAAIFAAVILTVSVFVVSASAKLFADDVITSYQIELIHIYRYGDQFNSGRTVLSGVTDFSVYDLDNHLVYSYNFNSPVFVIVNSFDGNFVTQPSFYYYDDDSNPDYIPIFTGLDFRYNYKLVCHSVDDLSSAAHVTTLTTSVPAAVSSLSGGVFSAGSSLLAFVQSSWLTLVALGAFLVVLCIGAIRRLVKGV